MNELLNFVAVNYGPDQSRATSSLSVSWRIRYFLASGRVAFLSNRKSRRVAKSTKFEKAAFRISQKPSERDR